MKQSGGYPLTKFIWGHCYMFYLCSFFTTPGLNLDPDLTWFVLNLRRSLLSLFIPLNQVCCPPFIFIIMFTIPLYVNSPYCETSFWNVFYLPFFELWICLIFFNGQVVHSVTTLFLLLFFQEQFTKLLFSLIQ